MTLSLACLCTWLVLSPLPPGPGGLAPPAAWAAPETLEPAPSRWRGSTLVLDQSATSQTLGVGSDYQSANPTYELWLAFKPRYTFFDGATNTLAAGLWTNLFLEVTSSETTTRYHEPVLGPTFLTGAWGRRLRGGLRDATMLSLGPRVVLPTDKAARNSGYILGPGLSAGVSQELPLYGDGARALRGARLGVAANFTRPLTRATSPIDGDLGRLRMDVAGRPVVSDQLRGQMNVKNALTLSFSADVQLLPRLGLATSYVLIASSVYAPPEATVCTPVCAQPMSVESPTTFRVSTWLTAALDVRLMDELSVSVGYLNRTSQIGPDGRRRNPLWSPDARFFLSLVGNLDAVLRRLTGAP
jgi:hypothetical protein